MTPQKTLGFLLIFLTASHYCLCSIIARRHLSNEDSFGGDTGFNSWAFRPDDLGLSAIESLFSSTLESNLSSKDEEDTTDYRWKDAKIPWKIYPAFQELLSYDVESRIREAMNEIENTTCVKFIRLKDDDNTRQPWVRFYEEKNYTYPDGLNCMSVSGAVFPGQDLMLGKDCMDHSMILHELMHTLGFMHEHQRPDRDEYILVNYENIPDFLHRQVEKIDYMDTKIRPFDFNSVLLYGPFDGSLNGQPVFTRKDGKKMLNRSDKKGLSEGDIYRINKYYNCPQLQLRSEPALSVNPP